MDRWRELRAEIKAQVLEEAWNPNLGAYVQYYGANELDASVLLMAMVGFLDSNDARFAATVDAIRRELTVDGLVQRYVSRSDGHVDGLPAGEGVFLPCSFWLAEVLALQGKHDEARELFERLLDLRNDVGLLAEEYDPWRAGSSGTSPRHSLTWRSSAQQ